MATLTTLWSLLERYVSSGWLFALFHVGLFVWFLRERRTLLREAEALETWQPTEKGKTECTRVLEQFVLDSRDLGGKGHLSPITDFTDRIDSVVDGMVGRTHDLINLFLVVGIAGTLLGLFRIGLSPEQGATVALVNLREGIEVAFPVAFFGILWYVALHIAVSPSERRLRSAAASAIDKLLKERRSALRSDATAIRDLTERLTALPQALEPLRDLSATLARAVDPVVQQFGQRIEHLESLFAERLQPLTEAAEAIPAALGNLREALQSAGRQTAQLESGLRSTSDLLQKLDAAVGELARETAVLEKVLVENRDLLAATARSLADAGIAIQQTPDGLRTGVREAMEKSASDVRAIWETATEGVRGEVTKLLMSLESTGIQAGQAVVNAASEWLKAAGESQRGFQHAAESAVTKVIDAANQHLPNVERVFANRFPQAVHDLDTVVKSLEAAAQLMRDLGEELRRTLADVRALPWVEDYQRSLDRHTTALEHVKAGVNDIVAVLVRLEAAERSTNEMLRNLAARRRGLLGRILSLMRLQRG